ncbi:hypothetical protein P700755_001843 [Psychroflexus torquis ATCC 700755]|uniref:DUF885 domain-containing protein n=1 Tax=Psychroflexus torquis (strain ATCC 700755 / CIP 106069 / ACAM 623) TaxID=313595 RepID=K4IHY1_PSYTT|nr:DUF885 domain-containing protein [Psychroflexus torquis]AFU68676.1 hypothetical protein P700755_001843 [Psychroflexus torquis ATCC 700755]
MTKKRTWKFWTSRTILILFLVGIFWLINLIWFRPFNIEHFYDKIFVELAIDSPELTTSVGIPILYDRSKDELDDISDAKQWESFYKMKEDYETLMSYDFESQSEENKLNTKILAFYLQGLKDSEPFFYHGYPVNQMGGIQSGLPSLMESAHKLRDESDVEAYISRLSKFDTKFEQLIENLKIAENKGIIPPKFVIKRVVDEMKGFTGILTETTDSTKVSNTTLSAEKSNILYTNFELKIDKLDEISAEQKTSYKKQVEVEIDTTVFRAYQNLIDYFEKLDEKATTDDGVWKLPNGAAYYRHQLKQSTTTNLNPEEVHQIGLSEVARIKSEMKNILLAEGYVDSTKTVGAIIQELNKEERFLFPNTDEGRQMVLDEYDRILSEISGGLDDAFDVRPKAGLEVKRVPEFKEEGSAGAYYKGPAMDDSRGGVFYANLRNVHESVKFGMKTLAYHEGIPGHHFQIAIQSELEGVPVFRTIGLFTAYVEGWALYSEQLGWELGLYDNDPFGNLGRLQAEMFRAVRLVVDTGIHYKKWTREEAIDYMVLNTGMTTTEVTTEIERYIVWPGQACAYKIGMLKILELREKSKQELGNEFDLREFHNVVLKNGAVPLGILEEIVDSYIRETLTKNII